MKSRWIFLISALILSACGNEVSSPEIDSLTLRSATVDVSTLLGEDRASVDSELGTPDCPPKNACVYGDRLEVYFVDQKAANFTLPSTDDLRVYGLTVGTPVFENVGVRRWEINVGGVPAEVNSFEGEYVYVKTIEP